MILDPHGIYGTLLVSGLKVSLLGMSVLAFIHFWRRGVLDFDEGPKYEMMKSDEERDNG